MFKRISNLISGYEPYSADLEREIVHRSKFRDLCEEDGSIQGYLIGHLDRIDSKVSAILTFDGVYIAILTVITVNFDVESELYSLAGLLLLIASITLASISIWICLDLIYLYGYHSSTGISAREYQINIIRGVVVRTKKFNQSLLMIKISALILIIYLIYSTILALTGLEGINLW